MTVLVIGASGNVGGGVLAGLRERGVQAVAALHRSAASGEARSFDYDEPLSWPAALEGVDRVFMIPKTGDPYPDRTLSPFIRQAKRLGVRRIVLLTAMALDRDWRVLRTAEDTLVASGLEYVILRPNWLLQNLLRDPLRAAVRNGVIAQPTGTASVSHVDARDCAEVATQGLLEDQLLGRAITLTGPRSWSWSEFCACLSEAAGHEVRFVDLPEDQFRDALLASGVQPYRVEQLQQMNRAFRNGLHAQVDPGVADILGRPARSVEAFAAEFASRWRR